MAESNMLRDLVSTLVLAGVVVGGMCSFNILYAGIDTLAKVRSWWHNRQASATPSTV